MGVLSGGLWDIQAEMSPAELDIIQASSSRRSLVDSRGLGVMSTATVLEAVGTGELGQEAGGE